jgi:citrate lyase subunit beta/citryl-CoA lyase
VIPKVENAEQIHQVAHIMKAFGAPKEMEIWGMIETPRGILKINQIAQSHPRLTALLAGTSDLSKVKKKLLLLR